MSVMAIFQQLFKGNRFIVDAVIESNGRAEQRAYGSMFQRLNALLLERDSPPRRSRSSLVWCWFALILLAGSISTQSHAQQWDACNPLPEVKAALDALPTQTPDELEWEFHEKKINTIQVLRRRYPDDVFVEKRYIDNMQDRTESPKVIDEFKAKWTADPHSPVLAYLYGVVLVGPESQESIKLFNRALEEHPKFPWPHLSLSRIFSMPKFRDHSKADLQLKAFLDACPTTFEGYDELLRADEDKAVIGKYAAQLRPLLEKRDDIDAVAEYRTLWALEFQGISPSEFEGLRERVARDLAKIRTLNVQEKGEWYDALEEGYRLANDQKNIDWVKNEREVHAPSPWYPPFSSKWFEDHHSPSEDASEEIRHAYNRELLAQTNKWIQGRPNSTPVWEIRLQALTQLNEVSSEEIETAADQLTRVAQKNAGPGGPESRVYFIVAGALSKKHLQPARVAELAKKGLEISEVEEKYFLYNWDSYLDQETASEVRFSNAYENLDGITYLAKAYIELKHADQAQITLSRMDERLQDLKTLAADKTNYKEMYLKEVSAYWGAMGRLAELQQRKLDAMGFYENALLARLEAKQKTVPGEKDELADNARRLWSSLGGTSAAWTMWYGRRANELARSVTLSWDEAKEPVPPFELVDLNDKTWTVESLKGKVTFLNFWASW